MASSLARCSSSTNTGSVRQLVYRNELNYPPSDEVWEGLRSNELTSKSDNESRGNDDRAV